MEQENFDKNFKNVVFDVKVKDAWIPVRIEMDDDWYLVGLPKTSLSGLTVRM